MKVFISWSGERSRQVAELLNTWIRSVIQAVDPWISSKDIDRGSLWFSEITDQLANTSLGIVCLTQENKDKPWILFESGALAKGLSSNRVCTFLIDLIPSDIKDPLAQFNHTEPNRESIWALIRTINRTLGERRLPDQFLENVFNTYWSQFETAFKKIISNTKSEAPVEKRSENDIMEEILSTVRSLERRVRSIETPVEILGHVEPVQFQRKSDASSSALQKSIDELLDAKFDTPKIMKFLTEDVGVSESRSSFEVKRALKRREALENRNQRIDNLNNMNYVE